MITASSITPTTFMGRPCPEFRANPQAYGKNLLIMLHGYGADGENLADLGPAWSNLLPDTDFLFPNGVEVCEVYDSGYQWFSLSSYHQDPYLTSPDTVQQLYQGATAAAGQVRDFILAQQQQRQLQPDNIVVAGFSQGGTMALRLGLYDLAVRAVVSFSGVAGIIDYTQPATYKPQVLLIHGDYDSVVPSTQLERGHQGLTALGVPHQSELIPGLAHTIDHRASLAAVKFLQSLLPSA